MSLDNQIDREALFSSFFQELSMIDKMPIGDKYKKLLYFSLLDGVAKFIYPESNNKARFVNAIENYSCWADGAFINVFQLNEYLKNFKGEYQKLEEFVSSIIEGFLLSNTFSTGNWGRFSPVPISIVDARTEEIQMIWSNYGKQNKFNIKSFNHYNLLYLYRCELVHSFQDPTEEDYGFAVTPSYIIGNKLIGFDENNDGELIVEKMIGLVYPLKFVSELIRSIIKNFHNECRFKGITSLDAKSLNKLWRLK